LNFKYMVEDTVFPPVCAAGFPCRDNSYIIL
jgi:hypothetical protein